MVWYALEYLRFILRTIEMITFILTRTMLETNHSESVIF